ncbi:MAG: glycosyltransferase family 2 protein [Myxococcota bacterium]
MTSSTKPGLSIVIMAYNEEDNLPIQVERTVAFLEGHADPWQVVIVNDGSGDRTGEIADEYVASHPDNIVAVHHPENRGMGAAIRNGYDATRCDWVTQLPADCQVDPQVFTRFLPHLATADLVLSVYRQRDDGWQRKVLSWGFQTFVRLVLGSRGDFTGTMMFRRSLLTSVGELHSESFFVNLEFPIRALKLGTAYALVEIEAQPRLHGQSKVANTGRIKTVIREALAMRRRERARR